MREEGERCVAAGGTRLAAAGPTFLHRAELQGYRFPPPARAEGEGAAALRCAVFPPAEAGGGAGPLRLIITPHYEVQSSAISGGGRRGRSNVVPATVGRLRIHSGTY